MALPILDGNQSATTLSTILSGGEHTPAHTVVSLGSTAISNITSAVSGITIAGTVTVGNSVTISNLPAISGTVTANVFGQDEYNVAQPLPLLETDGSGNVERELAVSSIIVDNDGYSIFNSSSGALGIPIAARRLGVSGAIDYITAENNRLDTNVKNSVTIGSLPTLTPQLPRVTFIDGSGTVTTANTAVTVFASSSTRSYLLVQVTTGSAFVNVGATATTVNGISLTAGQGYAWETTIPQGIVSLISTTTSSRYVAKQA